MRMVYQTTITYYIHGIANYATFTDRVKLDTFKATLIANQCGFTEEQDSDEHKEYVRSELWANVELARASRQTERTHTFYTRPEAFVVRKKSTFLVDAALALLAGFLLSVPWLLWVDSWGW